MVFGKKTVLVYCNHIPSRRGFINLIKWSVFNMWLSHIAFACSGT